VRSGIRGGAIEMERLAACFDRMAESLEQREESLRQSVDSLSRSNAELGRFAYVASHDLQEPLRTVVSYTQLLERRLGEQAPGDARDYMHFVIDGARRMSDLVHDLLEYSRVGTSVAPLGDVDLDQVVSAVLTSLDDAVRQSRGRVEVSSALPRVTGDQMQLGLLFQNLVGNALKYHRPDIDPVVRIDAERLEGGWVVHVADNGLGIDRRYRLVVFEAFKRLHAADAFPGTGIGLAIAKRIVERHGGHIWVEGVEGGGSRFCFTLPDHVETGRGGRESGLGSPTAANSDDTLSAAV